MTAGGVPSSSRDAARPTPWRCPPLLRLVAAAGLGLLAAGGCSDGPTVFRCAADQDCATPDSSGVCEVTGYCSFPDPSCAGTGRRYGRYSGDGLAGTCAAGSAACGEAEGSCCDGGLCDSPLVCVEERCVASSDAGGSG